MTSKISPPCSSPSFLFTEDEKKLLQKLQKTIIPLKKNRVDFFSSPLPFSSKKLSSSPQTPLHTSFPPILSPNIPLSQKNVPQDGPLPALEKHTARKIKSKHYSFSATLDLHGMTQERAHEKLVFFIENNFQRNNRSLLIITGKGQGILKKSLLVWLQNPALRPLIASVEQSLPHHGGEGAFYLILKKKKDF